MGMDRNSCMHSLQRVFVLQHFTPDEVGPYAEAIYESCGWIDSLRFEMVCKALVAELKTNVRLKPGHFIGKYKELAVRNNWNKADGDSRACGSCGGVGLVYVWVKDEEGREFKAMRGCGSCNSGMSGLKIGLTEIEAPFDAVPRIADLKFSPDHAKILWRIAEEAGFRLNEALSERLLYFASQSDKCIEAIERGMMSKARPSKEQLRELNATEEQLQARYANIPSPGFIPPAVAPKPAPAEVVQAQDEDPEPQEKPIQSTPGKISAEDAEAMDMPF